MTAKSYALALAAVFATSPALAADLTYSEPAPSYGEPVASSGGWTGAYVGGHIGTSSDNLRPFSGESEFMGGIQGGYNAEMGGAVVGGVPDAHPERVAVGHEGVPGADRQDRAPRADADAALAVALRASLRTP